MKLSKIGGVLICLIILSTCVFAQDFQSELQSQLNAAADYQYGGSRLALTAMDSLMHIAMKSAGSKAAAEKMFVQFLKTDASLASRQFVCRKLSLIGGDGSVSVLSKMIRKPETFDMALFALERIPSGKSDKVLRGMLKKTKGSQKIGIINALGMRKDAKAVTGLKKFVLDSDESIGLAAIGALGRIATEKAASVLVSLINETSGARKLAVYDAYLKYADALISRGNTFEAGEIYKKLSATEYPANVRQAAVSGWITSDQDPGMVCLDILKKGDATLQSAAIYHIGRMQKMGSIGKMADRIPMLGAAQKVQLIGALADRGDHSVADHVAAAVKDENPEVQIAALKALEFLGDGSKVGMLAALAAGKDDASKAAFESLVRVKGAGMDNIFIKQLGIADAKVKTVLLNAVGERKMAGVADVAYSLASDKSGAVRQAAMRTLGSIYNPEKIKDLLKLLTLAEAGKDRTEAENMIVTTAKRAGEMVHPVEPVLMQYKSVKAVDVKSSMLHVMGRIGDEAALPEIKKAVSSRNNEINQAGIRALSDWPTAAPLNDLMELAGTSKNATSRVLALRGYIKMIGMDDSADAEKKIVLYRKALEYAGERTNEKRLILSGVSQIRSVLALSLAGELLDQEDVKSEAEAAVARIADRIWRQDPDATFRALSNISDKITDKDRLEELEEIKQAIGRLKK